MNTNRTTPERLSWTTMALNYCFPLVRTLNSTKFSYKTAQPSVAEGTLASSTTLAKWITKLLPVSKNSDFRKSEWDPFLFYTDGSDENTSLDEDHPISDALEGSWNSIADWFIKNKKMLLEVDENIDIVADNYSDTEQEYMD
jgi:hypothetical protein